MQKLAYTNSSYFRDDELNTYTPQDLLEQFHSTGVADLFSRSLSKEELSQQSKLVKQKIGLVKKRIKQEKDVIKAQWDGRNKYEGLIEKRELAPFEKLEEYIGEVEIAISELEISGVRETPIRGKAIYGDSESREWHIGFEKDFILWQAKRRKADIDKAKEKLAQLTALGQEKVRKLSISKQNKASPIILLLGIALIAFGYITRSDMLIVQVGGFLIIISIIVFIPIWLYRNQLRGEIARIRSEVASLQKEMEKDRRLLAEFKDKYEEIKNNNF